jgi:large subunit ribosomal protein L35
MPKLKTKKGVKKRFKLTKKLRLKRARAGKGHILTKKSRKRKRGLRQSAMVKSTSAKTIRKLLPYG